MIPLYLQLSDPTQNSKFIQAIVRDSSNNTIATVTLDNIGLGLYGNNDTAYPVSKFITAQYIVYDNEGDAEPSGDSSGSVDVFGISNGLLVGDFVPAYYQLFNYDPTKFVQAVIRDDGNNIVSTLNLSQAGGLGLYYNNSSQMPNTDFLNVQYLVYDDSGHTVLSDSQGEGLDSFNLNPESSTPSNAMRGLTLPNMNSTILDWLQPMVFTQIVKTVVNFNVVETPIDTNFLGIWQPFSDQQLEIKPEGQRDWTWFMLHAQPTLQLVPDDVVTYLGIQYRVKAKRDYTEYKYIEYHLIENYQQEGL